MKFAVLTVAISVWACNDAGPDQDLSTDGTLIISTSTLGDNPDRDGYLLTVDGLDSLNLSPSGSAPIHLAAGRHALRLLGVAAQCSVTTGTEREVQIQPGITTSVAFEVSCAVTGVRVTVTTSGVDVAPAGYRVAADGSDRVTIALQGTVLIKLESGSRTIALTGLTPNCAISGPSSRTVTIVDGEVTQIEFAVACTATSGVIEVVVSATLEGIQFEVTLDGETRSTLVSGGPEYLTGVPAGDHVVSLSAPGCTVATNPQSVTITSGALTRDTATVSFSATCPRTGNLHITAPTTGPIPDTRYEVWTCSGRNCFYDYDVHFVGKVRPNGVLNATHDPGTYHIWMFLPPNCRPQFNSFDKQFTLVRGDTINVELPVACS